MDVDNMAFLPNTLIINVPEVDKQHAGLFARLAHLKNLCVESNCLPSAEADALLAALREHCATEERLAHKVDIDFTAHAQKHQKMLKGIDRALNEVREGRSDVFSLIRYIEYWFERHIMEEDLNLGSKLRQCAAYLDKG